MRFFRKVRFRLTFRALLCALVFLILAGLLSFIVLGTGFSGAAAQPPVLTRAGLVLSLPAWLFSGILALLALAFFLLFVFSVRSALIGSKTCRKLLETAEALGGAASVGDALDSVRRNLHTGGGELRYCGSALYYRKGTDAVLLSPSSITDIEPRVNMVRNMDRAFTVVRHRDGVLRIAANSIRGAESITADMKETFGMQT